MKNIRQTMQKTGRRILAIAAAVMLTLSMASVDTQAAEEGKKISELGVKNGIYTMGVTLEGGWIGTEITNPARVRIKDGEMTALIEWDSVYYTGMTVGGKAIELEKKREGNSKFVIPVAKTDAPITVTVVKTEFGQSVQTECTLTFHSDEIKKSKTAYNPGFATTTAGFTMFAVMLVVVAVMVFLHRKMKTWG